MGQPKLRSTLSITSSAPSEDAHEGGIAVDVPSAGAWKVILPNAMVFGPGVAEATDREGTAAKGWVPGLEEAVALGRTDGVA